MVPTLPGRRLLVLGKSISRVAPPLSPTAVGLLVTVNRGRRLARLVVRLRGVPRLREARVLATCGDKRVGIVGAVFGTLPALFGAFGFSGGGVGPLLLTGGSGRCPNLFSTVRRGRRGIMRAICLTLSSRTHLFKFATRSVVSF